MAHSLSFLLSSEAASARMSERKPAFVIHAEVSPGSDEPMVELDADSFEHAHNLAQNWLVYGRAASAAIRKVYADGTLGYADIFDLRDFEEEFADQTQGNLDRTMAKYGLVG
jgi:hypothetical protein